jgi:acyl CoA:acetate/3-ketoacid CoA transferase alpha subunit
MEEFLLSYPEALAEIKSGSAMMRKGWKGKCSYALGR